MTFSFPAVTLPGGGYFVIASDASAFNFRYNFLPNGTFSGGLSNIGEALVLSDSYGTIRSVTYGSGDGWPGCYSSRTRITYTNNLGSSVNGGGHSLVPVGPLSPAVDYNAPSQWRASYCRHGSPGQEDTSDLWCFILRYETFC